MALDTIYLYTLRVYIREVPRWTAATRVTQPRPGPLLALAIGGARRTVADELQDEMLIYGAEAKLGDGDGCMSRTGASLLFHALRRQELGHRFPHNAMEYKSMQNAIVREKTLEAQVGSLSNYGGMVPGQNGGNTYLVGAAAQAAVPTGYGSGSTQADSDWLPLCLCLGLLRKRRTRETDRNSTGL